MRTRDVYATLKLRKFFEIDGGYQLDPFLTNGVSLGSRDDWKHILGVAKELGPTFLCFSLHGMDEVHDRIVNSKGAFGLVCSAIERTHAAGLECHYNVFLTKDNTCQFSEILDTLKSLSVERTSFGPADYQPTKRGRRHEQIRPELGKLSLLAARAYEYETFSGVRKIWADLSEYTEEKCVSKALKSTKKCDDKLFSQAYGEFVSLVCLSNLDVYTGTGSYLGQYHGNLRNDGIRKVLSKAVDSDVSLLLLTFSGIVCCQKFRRAIKLSYLMMLK
jgi:MoaA/NifB/PqqE/SkfB family radical SAM enzyme